MALRKSDKGLIGPAEGARRGAIQDAIQAGELHLDSEDAEVVSGLISEGKRPETKNEKRAMQRARDGFKELADRDFAEARREGRIS